MKCPVDQTELLMSDRQGIEIDYCPKCRGVWLDRGELDKIIERAAASLAPTAPVGRPARDRRPDDRWYPDDRDRWYGEREYKRRKRRSFLEELFDFD